jgi:hypothetical protein
VRTAEHVEKKARIEIDVFSGRPNPAWDLGPEQARALAQLVQMPHERIAAPPAADGLGFRGFVVTFHNGGVERLRVMGSVVDDGHGAFRDADRRIEAFILTAMPTDLRQQFSDVLPH